jgi:hypothetical protein
MIELSRICVDEEHVAGLNRLLQGLASGRLGWSYVRAAAPHLLH